MTDSVIANALFDKLFINKYETLIKFALVPKTRAKIRKITPVQSIEVKLTCVLSFAVLSTSKLQLLFQVFRIPVDVISFVLR
jgi:hypothetical protein